MPAPASNHRFTPDHAQTASNHLKVTDLNNRPGSPRRSLSGQLHRVSDGVPTVQF